MISVKMLDRMGSDIDVVNAARVSFDKMSHYEWPGPKLSQKDEKLIQYLAKHNHWSPFSHCFASFRVKAPIFVARQLQKHTVGLSWNEVSRRYVDSEPEFYHPEDWRAKAENVKQGSSETRTVNLNQEVDALYLPERINAYALRAYDNMIEAGVCPEQARMVLPQSMMTEWIWSGSLFAFARVCNLRLDSHTQKETREVAALIADYMEFNWPYSWKALVKSG